MGAALGLSLVEAGGAALHGHVRAPLAVAFSGCRGQAPRAQTLAVAARRLWSAGSVVGAYGLSCPRARGIFLDQGSEWCPSHCRGHSFFFFIFILFIYFFFSGFCHTLT